MNRKLSVLGVILLGAAMLVTNGCGNSARAKNERESKSPAKAGRVVNELVGKWQKTRAGKKSTGYAVYGENSGDFESYEITEDGRVRYESLNAFKNYDCPVETSVKSEGAVFVSSASELNIALEAGTIEHREGCFSDRNYTSATQAATTGFGWKINRTEDGQDELQLTQANGETVLYRRVK